MEQVKTAAELFWEKERSMRFTSSAISPLFVKLTSTDVKEGHRLSKGARTYIREKAAEITTGKGKKQYSLSQFQWGIDNEPLAIEAAEKILGINFIHYGVVNPKFFTFGDYAGGSPDGETEDVKQGAEVKCPENSAIHLENRVIKSIAEFQELRPDIYDQIQMNMFIRKWQVGHFISFDPRQIRPSFRIKIISMKPDAAWQAEFMRVLPIAIDMLKSFLKEQEDAKMWVGLNAQPVVIQEPVKIIGDNDLIF